MQRTYHAKWFKTEKAAKAFQKSHGGALYRNVKYSKTQHDHRIAAAMFGFDPEEYPYSVNWTHITEHDRP